MVKDESNRKRYTVTEKRGGTRVMRGGGKPIVQVI